MSTEDLAILESAIRERDELTARVRILEDKNTVLHIAIEDFWVAQCLSDALTGAER